MSARKKVPLMTAAARPVNATAEIHRKQALLKTGALQNAILNSENFSIIATDEKGVIQLFNVGAERMLGYAAADVMNQITPADISDPEEVIERAKALSLELATAIAPGFEALVFKASRGIEDIYELTYIRKDGSRFPAVVSVTALRDDLGAIIGYLLIGTDNTERKKVEAEKWKLDRLLRESEERYHVVADAIIAIDEGGSILFVNSAAERIFGYLMPEMLGQSVALLMPNYFQHVGKNSSGKDIDTGNSPLSWDAVELAGRDKSGREIPLELSFGESIKNGRRVFTSIVRDVTARKEAEEKIRRGEELFRLIMEGVADLIAVIDRDGRRVYNSPSYKAIFGDTEALCGTDSFNEIHPEDQDLVKSVFERTVRTGVGESTQYRFLLKDGSICFIESRGSVIRDSAGMVEKVIVVSRDVTRHRTLERQLIQSQKMEAVGQLAGGVAHDFNNLLTVISGFCQLAMETLPDKGTEHGHLQEVLNAADRAASLTQQLLAFSRQQTLQPTVLNLNETVANADKMLRRLIGENIELVTVLAAGLGLVKADDGQIEQVIVNLVVNARDAMARGGHLTIETANVDLDEAYSHAHFEVKPGPYVMLAVSDTGCGMDAKTQARIFEPFFTTKGLGKGTGLGLSTVYGIVKQSGGNVWVYSEPGKGTTFKVYLPQVLEATATPKVSGGKPRHVRGTETIILVDDDTMVRKLVGTVLVSAGYKVLAAACGDEAISLAEKFPGTINLLITDLIMPGMSGRELATSMALKYPGIRVLYISGYTDHTVVRHHVLDPETPFLQKPFKPDSVVRKVREVLDAPQGLCD